MGIQEETDKLCVKVRRDQEAKVAVGIAVQDRSNSYDISKPPKPYLIWVFLIPEIDKLPITCGTNVFLSDGHHPPIPYPYICTLRKSTRSVHFPETVAQICWALSVALKTYRAGFRPKL